MMSLEERIRDIQSKLKNSEYPNEQAISDGVVSCLLKEMGWDTCDPKVVSPQYPPKEGKTERVDYALCVQKDKPVIFIEVKHPRNPEKTRQGPEQISRYVRGRQVPFGVWTDGERWYFYFSMGEGDCGEPFRMLDLKECNASEASSYLQRYLSFDKVSSGEALENARQDYKNLLKEKKARESIFEAWGKLIEEKDEKLIEVVSEKVKSIRGFKPEQQQVTSYLKSLKNPPVQPKTIRAVSREKKSLYKRIKVTFPGGREIQKPVVKDTFVETIEAIGPEKVKSLGIEKSRYPLVSKKKHKGKPRQFSWVDVSSGLHVNTRMDTKEKYNKLHEINKKLELGLKVELLEME